MAVYRQDGRRIHKQYTMHAGPRTQDTDRIVYEYEGVVEPESLEAIWLPGICA